MKLFLAIVFTLFFLDISRAEESPRWSPSDTFVLIVGVLDWQQQSLTKYAKSARQDVALKNQLVTRGVPADNITMVLDADATLATIQQSLRKVASQSTDDSTLIVYYAGHGMLDQGQGVFANFDIDTRRASETGWTHGSMARVISRHFRGKRVLLFADCCFSGALADVVDQLNENGFRSACLTSASSKNLSTNNWTFTMTLIDLLRGQALADSNGDGMISLREASTEVSSAMRHFEDQQSGFHRAGLAADFIVADSSPKNVPGITATAEVPSPFERGQYVSVGETGKRDVARIIRRNPDSGSVTVRYREYSRFRTALVDPQKITKIIRQKDSNGDPIALPEEQAKTLASVDGKYRRLLRTIDVPSDVESYGVFKDWGHWDSTEYQDHSGLPIGYWVYVYPRWYIWETRVESR